jgi:hypothetical protein
VGAWNALLLQKSAHDIATSAGVFTTLAATLFLSPVWAGLLYDPVDLADEF